MRSYHWSTHFLVGFAFVDDIDLLQTHHDAQEIIDDINEELQGSLDIWQSTLRSLDGMIYCNNPNKSYCYSVDYEWNGN